MTMNLKDKNLDVLYSRNYPHIFYSDETMELFAIDNLLDT